MTEIMKMRVESKKGREKLLRAFVFFWMGMVGILLGISYLIKVNFLS
jgi:hypothetical protein